MDIIGKKGKNEKIFLENSADNFERGKEDKFSVESINVGDIEKIRIGHNNEGMHVCVWVCV